jgi:hypothetical protein
VLIDKEPETMNWALNRFEVDHISFVTT